MKYIIWCKTLLSAYRYYERIALAIDNLVMKEALNSMGTSLIHSKTAEDVSNKILDYTEKKVALINAKLMVEKALYNIEKKHSLILIRKYLQGKRVTDIITEFDIPRRTFA